MKNIYKYNNVFGKLEIDFETKIIKNGLNTEKIKMFISDRLSTNKLILRVIEGLLLNLITDRRIKGIDNGGSTSIVSYEDDYQIKIEIQNDKVLINFV